MWKTNTLGSFVKSISETYKFSSNEEVVFLNTSDILLGKVLINNLVNSTNLPGQAKKKIKKGDLLFSEIRPANGRYALIDFEADKYVVSTKLMVLRCNENLDVNFFKLFLTSNEKIEYLQMLAEDRSGTFPQITFDQISALEIKLPSLPEQKAIASVLSSLDDKIDLLHRQNDTLEKMGETLFRKWFVEDAKEDWKVKKLSDYISIKHGYAFKGNLITAEKTNKILVTPGNFKIGGGFKSDKFKYYSSDEFPKSYIFNTNDLIVTMTDLSVDGDSLGSPALVPESYSDELFLHNQRVGRVDFKNEIGKYFLYNLMKTEDYLTYILGCATGTSIRHSSPTSICNYSFQFPPINKMKEFEVFAKSNQEKILKNNLQIKSLTKMRDTLLPKLMSGEVRVNLN